MIDVRDGSETNAAKDAWEMFEKTGDVFYYLAYKRLLGKK